MPAPHRPRATPWLDALALLLLGAGATVIAVAHAGLARLEAGWSPAGAGLGAATARYDQELRLTLLGVALAALGIVVGIVATVVTRRRHRAAALSPGTATH